MVLCVPWIPCEPSTTPHGITHSSQGVAHKVACHCAMNFIPFRESSQQDLFHPAWFTTTYYLLLTTYYLLLTTTYYLLLTTYYLLPTTRSPFTINHQPCAHSTFASASHWAYLHYYLRIRHSQQDSFLRHLAQIMR